MVEGDASSSTMPAGSVPSWWRPWEWRWRSSSSALATLAAEPSTSSATTVATVVEPVVDAQPIVATDAAIGGQALDFMMPADAWDRIKQLYDGGSMEVDIVKRVARMTFAAGFFVGGASGYAQARQTYEMTHVGTKYLSASDALKRRIDYGIVRFAKSGFVMGAKAAIISGSIVLLTTHLATYRQKFSSLYFPAISALVGGVFMFPAGPIGMAKAIGLGLTSGLTLSAVVQLYALSIDKPANDAYWIFKRDYEHEIYEAEEWERRVKELMTEEKIWWRQRAVAKLKQQDAERLAVQDA